MKRHLVAAAWLALFLAAPASAQTPVDQLMVPPAGATRYVIISPAGEHGRAAVWRAADGAVNGRWNLLLRGFVVESDLAFRLAASGVPERVVIRGFAPSGDIGETFETANGQAQWRSRVDNGSAPFDGSSFYLPNSNDFVSTIMLAEALYRAPGRRLGLLPGGEARLTPLAEATVGEGAARRIVTAYAIEGADLEPIPVWFNADGSFFGSVGTLSLLPEAYAGARGALETAQEEALARQGPDFARRLAPASAGPVAFTHVRLFDAENGRFLDDQNVVVEGGRIAAVGPAASVQVPANARVIDGRGKTLVPGIWDAHMHVGSDRQGLMLFAIGVTSGRDPGSAVEPTLRRRARIARGDLLFPTIYSSVLIDGVGPLQAQIGVNVDSAQAAVAAVRQAHANGFTGVKFYTSMQREWLLPGIAEAHRLGLHVHGHVPAGMRPADAIAAGYDEITHINFIMMQAMPDDVVARSNGSARFHGIGRHSRNVDLAAEPMRSLIADMARRRIVADPTLVVYEGGLGSGPVAVRSAYTAYDAIVPPLTSRGFRGGGQAPIDGATQEDYRASYERLRDLTGALHRAGVPIVAGTDGSGLEIHRELELYVETGMTPAQALQTATIAPARLVGAERTTGSIAVGKEADLVLVDGDPSQDISVLRRTLWVMSDGRLMDADALREAAGFRGRPGAGARTAAAAAAQ